ncbi:MAG: hypothetical protein HQM08_17075 [Candidatus Riflebacteria bacterium]|nr:hypothetical protein [Candidatus Riflebacteria bacterium]
MTEWENLLEIQKFDLELDEIHAKMARENDRTKKFSSEVRKESDLLAQQEEMLKKINLRKRKLETELNEVNDKIRVSEMKLKNPGMSPNVYMSLSKEIETLKGKIPALENSLLEDMEKVEKLEKYIETGKKVSEGRKKQLEDIKNKVSVALTGLKKDEDLVRTQRNQLSFTSKGYGYEVYEKLRLERKGRVIFDIDKPSCPSCGLKLPGGVVSTMMGSGAFESCPNCGMFLHWTGIADGIV